MGVIPTSVDERVTLLKKLNSPYYQGLNDDQLCVVVEPARLIEARAGEFLYHQGEPANYSYLLVNGLVQIMRYHPNGRKIIVKFIKPGLAFRIAYFGVGSQYCASAQAATEVRALRWHMHDAMHMLQTFPSIVLNSVAIQQQMYITGQLIPSPSGQRMPPQSK